MKQPENLHLGHHPDTHDHRPEERSQMLLVEIRRLLAAGDGGAALVRLGELHPADQGEVLIHLDRGARLELLLALSPSAAAHVLEHIEPRDGMAILKEVESRVIARILDQASSDVSAAILRQLEAGRNRQVLEAMADASEVATLLQYRGDTAGGLMTLDYPVVNKSLTTANALDQLRLLGPEAERINSVLVVDQDDRLVGSMSLARLALARPGSAVQDIMDRDLISVDVELDQEDCARMMERYDLNQLPVIDTSRRLVGVILSEDMVDVVEQEATEDMYRMAGVAGERILGPLKNSLRRRLPWLYINLATALLAAFMISIFEATITKVVALVIFLPVVAGQGGIGGTQTVTLVVRSMALGELPRQLGLRLLTREVSLGLINGASLGLVVGLVAYLWKGNFTLGIVLGVAMLGNMIVAGLAGAGVPLLLRYRRMDPAVSSAVFVTTFTDVIGFVLFLGLAAMFI